MAAASIELRDLRVGADIGTYRPADVVPDEHLLDLTLTLSPHLVHVPADDMAQVFDYDPLVARIDRLARECHYATQEYLASRIVAACAAYPQISGVEVCLRKRPVLQGTGALGVRLRLDEADLQALRAQGTG